MHTAIVELDPLADTVRPAAEDDHFFTRGRRRFVLAFVSRIEVGRERFEFRATGIHRFENRRHAEIAPCRRHRSFLDSAQVRDSPIGKSHRLEFAKVLCAQRLDRNALFFLDELGDGVDKPSIDFTELLNLGTREAEPERVRQMVQSMAAGSRDLFTNLRNLAFARWL